MLDELAGSGTFFIVETYNGAVVEETMIYMAVMMYITK